MRIDCKDSKICKIIIKRVNGTMQDVKNECVKNPQCKAINYRSADGYGHLCSWPFYKYNNGMTTCSITRSKYVDIQLRLFQNGKLVLYFFSHFVFLIYSNLTTECTKDIDCPKWLPYCQNGKCKGKNKFRNEPWFAIYLMEKS